MVGYGIIVTMNKSQKYRLKDLDAYREKKREYAKTPEQREKRREYMRKWREENRERHNELARESHARNKDKLENKAYRTNYHLKNTYGITSEDYDQKLLEQNGVCALCETPPKKKRLNVDHNHETGEVRKLLCTPCNTKIGWYEKNREKITKYLR